MNNRKNKVFIICLGVIFLCSVTVCAYADIKGIVKSASEYDYPPFCIVSEDGKADGFSVELLRAALHAVDLDVEFKTGPWEKLKEELSEGTIQVLPLVGRTPEREAIYDFTFPYLSVHGAVFVRKGESRIKTLGDLTDKIVVVMKGDNADEFVRRKPISSHIITVDTYSEAMNLLNSGKYDAVISQRLMGTQLLKKMGIKTVVPLDFIIPDFKQDFCFAVRDGDRELLSLLNEGLSIVIADGTFDRLHKKWFGPILGHPITFKDVIRYLLFIFIPLSIISVLVVIVLLRRQVKNKTESLRREIDDRKQAEESLRRSEEQFRSIISTSKEWIWAIDLAGKQTYCNPAIENILGYHPDEIVGHNTLHLLHEDDLPKVKQLIARCLEQKTGWSNLVLRWKHRDGYWRYLESNAVPILNSAGVLAGFQGSDRDITERRKTEEKLHWFNELMKYVISHAQTAIAVHDRDMKYIYVSDQYLKQYNVKETDIIGKHHYDVFPDLPQKWRDVHQRVLAGAVESKDEDPYVREDGTVDWTRWECRPWYEYDGSIGGLIVYTEVITERVRREEALRSNEERLRLAVSGGGVGIWEWEISSGKLEWNDQLKAIFGLPMSVTGMKLEEFLSAIHPEDLSVTERSFRSALAQHTEFKREYRIIWPDGSVHWIVAIGRGIYDPEGRPIRMMGCALDITERKQAEKEKEKLQAQLLQAQKMEAVGHLAGGVAHDFNNILSTIIGYAHINLMKMKVDDPLRVNLERILSSSEKAANLTKSLLAFSRKQVMQIKPVNLNSIVSGMTTIFDRLIGEDIHFQVNTAVHDLIVNVDTNQIEQVIINLATNARDAMPYGGTLTIKTEEIEIDDAYVRMHQEGQAGKYAVLLVTDTGMGMDEKTMENLFEPFFTTKEVGKGTGLGLAMIYGTIKQHNGFINVYSETGRGTTFKIYLPLSDAVKHVMEKKSTGSVLSGRETILLVEDSEDVRPAIRAMLQEHGYSVIEAVDGKQAMRLFGENLDIIQLVITDVIMPGLSGKDLHQELIKIDPDVKVIFVSGYPADVLAKRGILDTDVNFIYKPLKPEILFKKVREVLDEIE